MKSVQLGLEVRRLVAKTAITKGTFPLQTSFPLVLPWKQLDSSGEILGYGNSLSLCQNITDAPCRENTSHFIWMYIKIVTCIVIAFTCNSLFQCYYFSTSKSDCGPGCLQQDSPKESGRPGCSHGYVDGNICLLLDMFIILQQLKRFNRCTPEGEIIILATRHVLQTWGSPTSEAWPEGEGGRSRSFNRSHNYWCTSRKSQRNITTSPSLWISKVL